MLIKNNLIGDPEFATAMKLFELLTEHGFGIVNLHGIDPTTGQCTCRQKAACAAPGKHPYRWGWKKKLAVEHKEVENLLKLSLGTLAESERNGEYTHYIRSNFGLACGGESKKQPGKYLVVVDIDQCPEMITRLDACSEPTVNYYTGSGGKHYLYLSSRPVKNSVSSVALGVDIRGEGGYAIIPPSTNENGDYGRIAPEMIIRDLPDFLAGVVADAANGGTRKKTSNADEPDATATPATKKPKGRKPRSDDQEKTPAAPELNSLVKQLLSEEDTMVPCGARNQTLYIYLCSLRAKGALKGKLFDAAREFIASRFEKPETFSEGELATLVTSVAKFPPMVRSHPEAIRVYVDWAINNKKVPAEYGKNSFQFRKDINHLDVVFFQVYLPAKIRENIRNNGRSYTMQEIQDLRAEYYAARDWGTEHFPKLHNSLVGIIFRNEYPFYRKYDKHRPEARRAEWYLREKEHDDYMAALEARRQARRELSADEDHVVGKPLSSSPAKSSTLTGGNRAPVNLLHCLPETRKSQELRASRKELVSGVLVRFSGRNSRGSRGLLSAWFAENRVALRVVLPWFPEFPPLPSPLSPHGFPVRLFEFGVSGRRSVGVRWLTSSPPLNLRGKCMTPVQTGSETGQLTNFEECAKVSSPPDGMELSGQRRDALSHEQGLQAAASFCSGTGAGRGGSGWFRAFDIQRSAVQPLRSAAHGSGFAATGNRACLQCSDHEAGGHCEDRGELSDGCDHGKFHRGGAGCSKQRSPACPCGSQPCQADLGGGGCDFKSRVRERGSGCCC